MNNFCLDKFRVKQAFSNASSHYDEFAQLQRDVADQLVVLSGLTKLPAKVLDIGCGTGYLTQLLCSRSGHSGLVAMDIAMPMLQVVKSRIAGSLGYVCGDAEQLPFQTHCFGSIFSNLALQWCPNLQAVLVEFRRILVPGGKFYFSTFGPQTLIELKQAWSHVDQFRHVNEFTSIDELQSLLEAGQWMNCRIERRYYQLKYPSVISLMQELKGLGAHNAAHDRNRQLTPKSSLSNMIEHYPIALDGEGITATFEVIWVSAEAG